MTWFFDVGKLFLKKPVPYDTGFLRFHLATLGLSLKL